MSRWRRTLVLAGACAALAPVRAPARRRRGVVLLADDAEECDVFDPSPECLTEAEAMSCGAWEECSFNIGDRVRVVSDAVVYHHPKHKAGLAVRGLVGSVSGLASVARDGSGARGHNPCSESSQHLMLHDRRRDVKGCDVAARDVTCNAASSQASQARRRDRT